MVKESDESSNRPAIEARIEALLAKIQKDPASAQSYIDQALSLIHTHKLFDYASKVYEALSEIESAANKGRSVAEAFSLDEQLLEALRKGRAFERNSNLLKFYQELEKIDHTQRDHPEMRSHAENLLVYAKSMEQEVKENKHQVKEQLKKLPPLSGSYNELARLDRHYDRIEAINNIANQDLSQDKKIDNIFDLIAQDTLMQDRAVVKNDMQYLDSLSTQAQSQGKEIEQPKARSPMKEAVDEIMKDVRKMDPERKNSDKGLSKQDSKYDKSDLLSMKKAGILEEVNKSKPLSKDVLSAADKIKNEFDSFLNKSDSKSQASLENQPNAPAKAPGRSR